MHPPVSAERWAALRALREGAPPIFPLLAAAAGLHVTTIRERASSDNWEKQNYPRRWLKASERAALPARIAAPQGGAGDDWATPGWPDAGQEMRLEDLRQRFADVLPRLLGKILSLAERGIVDKARIDALISIGRVFERSVELAEQGAVEKQKRSDDELAGMLGRIDDRIVELAEAYAQRLGAAKPRDGAG